MNVPLLAVLGGGGLALFGLITQTEVTNWLAMAAVAFGLLLQARKQWADSSLKIEIERDKALADTESAKRQLIEQKLIACTDELSGLRIQYERLFGRYHMLVEKSAESWPNQPTPPPKRLPPEP
jgi:hypothetical protein